MEFCASVMHGEATPVARTAVWLGVDCAADSE
jgi:hypothetical protein